MTEVIIISNNTELDRMPRDNDGQEILEGPYQRLRAQYGNWENSGSKHYFYINFVIITLVNMCL